uniref:Uncharacterized protein n=1 Tax=Candidatus Kentrum sp. TC TaxID=2126339 RepID=A0A450Z2B9_9GAMM|nr:MAG: hypothetical protein BECKTC1821D_GA0114238_10537 [Candidatus Kentron sp. TC]
MALRFDRGFGHLFFPPPFYVHSVTSWKLKNGLISPPSECAREELLETALGFIGAFLIALDIAKDSKLREFHIT